MNDYEDRRRVRLLVDLTHYHSAFVVGAEGSVSHYPYQMDRFFTMTLDDGSRLKNVLWSSVEIVAESGLKDVNGARLQQT